MNTLQRRAIHGALGGAIGAACMTALRMLAHRARLIDQMVPQAVESWAQHHAPIAVPALPSQRALHHVADQILHLGYGVVWGALYGSVLPKPYLSTGKVLGFGVAVWALGSFVVLPALHIARPEWKARPREIAVNLGAHLLYAGALALVTDELENQSAFQPLTYPLSAAASTG